MTLFYHFKLINKSYKSQYSKYAKVQSNNNLLLPINNSKYIAIENRDITQSLSMHKMSIYYMMYESTKITTKKQSIKYEMYYLIKKYLNNKS